MKTWSGEKRKNKAWAELHAVVDLACLKQDRQCLCCTEKIIDWNQKTDLSKERPRRGAERQSGEEAEDEDWKSFVKGVFSRREQPTALKASTEFKKEEHRSRRLRNIFMEGVNKLISFWRNILLKEICWKMASSFSKFKQGFLRSTWVIKIFR